MDVQAQPAIVIVEDDQTLGWMLSKVLEQLAPGYPIHICIDGLEALAYLVQHPVCCVITDYAMPSMDGLTLTEVVSNQWPNIPVVLITGERAATVEKQAQEQTTNYVTMLVKPVSIERLREVILPLLNKCDSSSRQRLVGGRDGG